MPFRGIIFLVIGDKKTAVKADLWTIKSRIIILYIRGWIYHYGR